MKPLEGQVALVAGATRGAGRAIVSVIRLAFAMAWELRRHPITALAVTPGFLRSEAMLDNFGVTEANWRDGVSKSPHFIASETPFYVGRAVAALAAGLNVASKAGRVFSSWDARQGARLQGRGWTAA